MNEVNTCICLPWDFRRVLRATRPKSLKGATFGVRDSGDGGDWSAQFVYFKAGLKEAIANESGGGARYGHPGGRVDICLEMMEMLDRFRGSMTMQ